MDHQYQDESENHSFCPIEIDSGRNEHKVEYDGKDHFGEDVEVGDVLHPLHTLKKPDRKENLSNDDAETK